MHRQYLFDGLGMLRYTLTCFMLGFMIGAITSLVLVAVGS